MAIFGNKARAAALCVAILIVLYGTTEVAPIRAAAQGYWPKDRPERYEAYKLSGSKDSPVALGFYDNPLERSSSVYQQELTSITGGGGDVF